MSLYNSNVLFTITFKLRTTIVYYVIKKKCQYDQFSSIVTASVPRYILQALIDISA